jgi:hypothetical protein
MTRRLTFWRTVAMSASVGGGGQKPRLEALGSPIDKDAFKEDDVVVEI